MKRIVRAALSCFVLIVTPLTAFAGNSTAVLEEYRRLTGSSDAEAKAQFGAAIQALKNEMKAGREVTIQNFGRFYIQDREARQARNPRSGEAISLPAMRYPRFVSADKFKDEMNQGPSVLPAANVGTLEISH